MAFVAKVDSSSPTESNLVSNDDILLSSDDESELEALTHEELYDRVDELYQMGIKYKKMIMNLNIMVIELEKDKDKSVCVLNEKINTLSNENDKGLVW